jgi:carbonic anhydrase
MKLAPTSLALVVILWAMPSWSTDPQPDAGSHAAPGGDAVHWDYDGEEGPARWGQLSPDYSACAKGRSQSPIDLPAVALDDLGAGTFDYNPADFEAHPNEHPEEVINNGHTIQVGIEDGASLIIGDERFQLVQFHFHAPSEHTVAGRTLPMEVHLVHRSDSGTFAVVGVLIAEGGHNPAVEPIWEHLPGESGTHESLADLTLDLEALIPKRRLAFRYLGSLTTPPCSEGVRWFVLAEPIELSAEQIAEFSAIYDDNNRPTQPLRGRSLVLEKVE